MTRYLLILPFLLLACGQEIDPADDNTLTVVASAENDAFKAELLSKNALRVGRNVVVYRVTTLGGDLVDDATLAHETTMHMQMEGQSHAHSSPSVDPGADGQGEIIFTMPAGELGTWDIALTVTRSGEEPSTIVFVSVPVADSDARKDITVGEGEMMKKYFVTLNFDSAVKVGLNPFVLTVHEKGMHAFPAVTTLDVTFTPEMPTMGHGSPDNVKPVHKTNGNYEGVVNFTMPGLWHLDFAVGDLGSVQYAIDF